MSAPHFELPAALSQLIAAGKWPSASGPSMTEQQSQPLVPPERVRLFAPDESLMCLQAPPFHTLAQERDGGGAGDFWEKFGSLNQIDPERALVIGDFGLGSDSPIILDYADSPSDPTVRRLRWNHDKSAVWEVGAVNFDAFARLTGLLDS
jgi:hypothetical protein